MVVCKLRMMLCLGLVVMHVGAQNTTAQIISALGLPAPLTAALITLTQQTGSQYDPDARCPVDVQTDPKLDPNALIGYWDVLGVLPPAVESVFDCPMMNITAGGLTAQPGHNTEHYKAYLQGHLIQFKGDEFAPSTGTVPLLCTKPSA